MADDIQRLNAWTALFERKGGSHGNIRIWSAWDESARASVRSLVPLRAGELPVILALPIGSDPKLLTTRRVCRDRHCLDVNSIANVSPVDLGARSKLDLKTLRIAAADGTELDLDLEPGRAFVAFWSVLLNAMRGATN